MVQNDNRSTQTELIPKLRFRDYKEPWTLKKIGDVLTLVTRPIKMKDEEVYSLVTVKRRYGGIVPRGDYKGKEVKVKSQFLLEENDFLISKRQISHNACGLVPKNLVGSIVSNEYSVFLPKENMNIEYFDYFSQLPKVSQTFFLSSTGVHIEKMIFKVDTWFKWEFPFPSINEQQKITSFLSAVDEKIHLLNKKYILLNTYKEGVIQKIFSKEIKFADEKGEPFPNWEQKKLGDMLEQIVDNRGKTPPIDAGEHPLIEVNAVGKRKINFNVISKFVSSSTYKTWFRKYLKKGDVLFSTVGATGLCSIYEEDRIAVIAQNLVALRFKTENPLFMFYLLTEKHNNHKFKRIEMGAVQPSLKVSQIINIKFAVPKVNEQNKIAEFLSSIDMRIERVNEQIEQTETFKKGILQKVFV